MAMTISPKMKKILAASGAGTLLVVCVLAMTKCSSNASQRDEARDSLTAQTARADSLVKVLNHTASVRDKLRHQVAAQDERIRLMQEDDSALTDSIDVLNTKVEDLVAAKDSLQSALENCRGAANAVPARKKTVVRKKANKVVKSNGCKKQGVVKCSENNAVTSTGGTTVNVSGGCGNTVNVNNGTVNNYYCPAPQPVPAKKKVTEVHADVSVTTTRIVTMRRDQCR